MHSLFPPNYTTRYDCWLTTTGLNWLFCDFFFFRKLYPNRTGTLIFLLRFNSRIFVFDFREFTFGTLDSESTVVGPAGSTPSSSSSKAELSSSSSSWRHHRRRRRRRRPNSGSIHFQQHNPMWKRIVFWKWILTLPPIYPSLITRILRMASTTANEWMNYHHCIRHWLATESRRICFCSSPAFGESGWMMDFIYVWITFFFALLQC